MAIIFTDGFEAYADSASDALKTSMCLDDRYIGGGGSTFSFLSLGSPGIMMPGTPPGQFLSFSNSTSSNNRLMINFAPTTSICAGFHVMTNAGSANLITFFNSSASSASNDVIQLYTSSNVLFVKGQVAYSGTATLTTGTWNYIEFQVTTNGQTMTFNLYLNGQLVLNRSNVQALSSTVSYQNIDSLSIGRGNTSWVSGSGAIQNYDNFYVTTGERLGLTYMVPVVPVSDTAQKNWLPSDGADNFAVVNDQIIGTSQTYVTANNVNDADYYDITQINRIDGNTQVLGVLPYMQAAGSPLGTTSVELKMKNNTTETVVATASLSASRVSSVTRPSSIMTTNPSTSTAWNLADVQNMQLGIKRSS
ncbi:MAG: hypothetical protein M0R77_02220 [Gammaproteobacteria bacterium]|nr:hypothetical protein [Gammaproteobacteria bacterium]